MKFSPAAVEQKIGYRFNNKKLLEQAFVHASYGNEKHLPNNDRMEYLGDAVLEYLSSEYIYQAYPDCNSGKLTEIRASVVSAKALAPVVEQLGILPYLSVNSPTVLKQQKEPSNLYESVLCAIYLDGGMPCARDFVLRTLQPAMDRALSGVSKDSITLVKEHCDKSGKKLEYTELSRTGPDHDPIFTYALLIDGQKVSDGSGNSKRAAKQQAASKIVKNWRID